MLASPRTISTIEAPINHHFLPRKSKFVSLKISIEPSRTGCLVTFDTALFGFVPDHFAKNGALRQMLKAVICRPWLSS